MLRELVSNNIFVFTSELYAQVTAGAILTPAGAIVIDTLPFPSESRQLVQFLKRRYDAQVRYVINTHHHADHTYGTCFFEDAIVVSHQLCREWLDGPGRAGLAQSQRGSTEMSAIKLRLPDVVFDDGGMNLHLGGTTLKMWHAPGHSPDSIVCFVEEERILFAADTMMAIPFFADGSWSDFVATLEHLQEMQIECVVQGHGEVILRGEVSSRITEDLDYLHALRERVEKIVEKELEPSALDDIDIEECGKNRIALNGLVQQLHRTNAEALYWTLMQEQAKA